MPGLHERAHRDKHSWVRKARNGHRPQPPEKSLCADSTCQTMDFQFFFALLARAQASCLPLLTSMVLIPMLLISRCAGPSDEQLAPQRELLPNTRANTERHAPPEAHYVKSIGQEHICREPRVAETLNKLRICVLIMYSLIMCFCINRCQKDIKLQQYHLRCNFGAGTKIRSTTTQAT